MPRGAAACSTCSQGHHPVVEALQALRVVRAGPAARFTSPRRNPRGNLQRQLSRLHGKRRNTRQVRACPSAAPTGGGSPGRPSLAGRLEPGSPPSPRIWHVPAQGGQRGPACTSYCAPDSASFAAARHACTTPTLRPCRIHSLCSLDPGSTLPQRHHSTHSPACRSRCVRCQPSAVCVPRAQPA